jgi:LacI family transcriptional regulator
MSRPTIEKVAKQAGVSKSTVSYVLSGKRKISDQVTERVKQAIEELNYTPRIKNTTPQEDHVIQVYDHIRTKVVGLFVPILQERLSDDFFYYPLIEGVMDSLNMQHYRLLLNRKNIDMDDSVLFDFNADHLLDGIILMNPLANHTYLDYLNKEKVPFVIIGTPEQEADVFYVDIDIISAAYRAANTLFKKGHSKLFIINHKKDYIQASQLQKGFQMAYEEAGYTLDPRYIVSSPINMAAGYTLCKQALEENLEFSAVIAQNEIVAKGVLQALDEYEVSVPEQVAVIALGGNPIGQLNTPRITSIDFSPYDMGFQAAKMLIEVIKKKRIRPSHILLPTKLIEGETC